MTVRRISLLVACGVLLVVQVVLAESNEEQRWKQTAGFHDTPGLSERRAEIKDTAAGLSFIPRPKALTSRDPKKFNELDKAYLDAFSILSEDNSCSRLYGGPPAIEALTEFVQKLKPTYLDRSIALRMSGRITMFQNNRTGFTFRLFEKAEINLGGPFYRSNGPMERHVALTGKYEANTRESRLVVLLHELGHLVRGVDKQWLLEDDGNDRAQSVRNSEFVTNACSQQIQSIRKISFAELFQKTELQTAQVPALPVLPGESSNP